MSVEGTGPGGAGIERLEAVVRGRVQGVGFRFFVLQIATELALDGWVANQSDGSVRCHAEGERRRLDQLAAALRTGPASARVDSVETRWCPAGGTVGGFSIRSGGHTGD